MVGVATQENGLLYRSVSSKPRPYDAGGDGGKGLSHVCLERLSYVPVLPDCLRGEAAGVLHRCRGSGRPTQPHRTHGPPRRGWGVAVPRWAAPAACLGCNPFRQPCPKHKRLGTGAERLPSHGDLEPSGPQTTTLASCWPSMLAVSTVTRNPLRNNSDTLGSVCEAPGGRRVNQQPLSHIGGGWQQRRFAACRHAESASPHPEAHSVSPLCRPA